MRIFLSILLFLAFTLHISYVGGVGLRSLNEQTEFSVKKSDKSLLILTQEANDLSFSLFIEEIAEEEVDDLDSHLLFALIYCYNIHQEIDFKPFNSYSDFINKIETGPLFLRYCCIKIPLFS